MCGTCGGAVPTAEEIKQVHKDGIPDGHCDHAAWILLQYVSPREVYNDLVRYSKDQWAGGRPLWVGVFTVVMPHYDGDAIRAMAWEYVARTTMVRLA